MILSQVEGKKGIKIGIDLTEMGAWLPFCISYITCCDKAGLTLKKVKDHLFLPEKVRSK